MKLKKGLLMIGSVAFVLGASAYGVANADDTTPTAPTAGKAQGNTYITFTTPTTGQLTLDKVPTYDFGTNQLSSTVTQYKTNGNNPYTATNLTGDSNGYTITASASPLKNSDAVLPVKDLLVSAADGAIDATTKGQLSGAQNVNIYSSTPGQSAANKVATGNASSNGTLSSGDTSSVMDLSTANGIKSGKYTGTIDYTITDGIN
ncbi:cell surface protein [Fructilactobacillus frigidiflavus]|uniref:cell surface protein n=1 Tax=Fructilactobacillus frigidiflavus TaxID=3242688 RepID=UPI003756C939